MHNYLHQLWFDCILIKCKLLHSCGLISCSRRIKCLTDVTALLLVGCTVLIGVILAIPISMITMGEYHFSLLHLSFVTIKLSAITGRLWLATHPVDITNKWQDDWKSASVVNFF